MGAFAVIASRSRPAGQDAVLRALRAAPHRGEELEVRTLGTVTVGASNDPGHRDTWTCEQDGRLAVFSGTLDNAAELAAELAGRGLEVDGGNPASVVLELTRLHGRSAVERLRGIFAGSVCDGLDLWCFRDHLGQRSLFFHANGRGFVAASEAKQVAAGAGIRREPDVDAVGRAFWGQLDERETVLKGIERFPRAAVGGVADGRVSFHRYWQPERLLETARLTVGEACERLDALLDQAVARTVTGRDLLMLSGGIDSPTVAAYAAGHHVDRGGSPLPALTYVYPDYPSVDEERYARLVADHLGMPMVTVAQEAGPLEGVEQWVDLLDGPTNVIAVSQVADGYRRARARGARTVMTGELAEFAFTQSSHLVGHLLLHGRARAAAGWARSRRARGRSWRSLAREAVTSVTPAPVAMAYLKRRGRGQPFADWLVKRGSRRWDLAIPARRRWSTMQLSPYLSPVVSFEAADVCAAVCGVHERKPLADIDLWEFLLSLRAETKFPDAVWKSLLRRTLRGRLPDPVLDRRDKTAFDEFVLGTVDYGSLERLVVRSQHRIEGVDYQRFARHVERRDFEVGELVWAYDLARTHAFLDLWS